MKLARGLVIAVLVGASVATAAIAQLTQPVINALTPIDELPSTKQINVAHGGEQQALANLTAIALSEDAVDLGVQLRAVRALTYYCRTPCESHEAHTTIATIATLPRYRDARRGRDLLVLRAAIEALGVLRVPGDVAILVPQLEHPSRDIRAATAHALRDLGNTQAVIALRARYQQEQVDQVKIAISDALRVLGQPVQ
jgi:HEAT repeat protein